MAGITFKSSVSTEINIISKFFQKFLSELSNILKLLLIFKKPKQHKIPYERNVLDSLTLDMPESKTYFEWTIVHQLGLMNLGLSTLFHSYMKSCKPQEEDSEKINRKDNLYVVTEHSLFLNFYDAAAIKIVPLPMLSSFYCPHSQIILFLSFFCTSLFLPLHFIF